MSANYGVSEAFPHVCCVYTCECGRQFEQHGREAGVLPAGWERRSEDEPDRHLCDECCRRQDS